MRNMKRIVALALMLVMMLGMTGCAQASAQKYTISFFDAFDTITSIIGYAESQEVFDRVMNEAREMFRRYHRVYDGYNDYDGVYNLHYVNAHAAQGPVKAEKELIDLLLWVRDVQPTVNNRVNVALGSVLLVWHNYREAGVAVPPMEELEKANQHVNFDHVVIDEANGTIHFTDPGVRLDVGAVAKGYAVECVAKWLLTSEVPSFIISAGGNVRCGEKPLDGRARWGVSIQNPDGMNGEYLDVLYLKETSIVTSGDYQRYYTVDGQRYHHIIDPDTLYPCSNMRSVTIVTEDSGYADALSTSVFLMPYEEGRQFVESLDGVEAFWVLMDGTIQYTDGLRNVLLSCGASSK